MKLTKGVFMTNSLYPTHGKVGKHTVHSYDTVIPTPLTFRDVELDHYALYVLPRALSKPHSAVGPRLIFYRDMYSEFDDLRDNIMRHASSSIGTTNDPTLTRN